MSESVSVRSGRQSLHQEVANSLRSMILNHELMPGDKIDEQALCKQFDVSRTPLREALKVLSQEGHIELMTHRGARVAVTSADDVRHYFPIIGALEALAGELACHNVTDSDIAWLQFLHDEMVACAENGDLAGYAERNRAIHLGLFELADNPPLQTLYQQLSIRTRSVRHTARKTPDELSLAINDHEEIIQALRDRDGARIGTILRNHLNKKAEMVLKYLSSL
ncbi:GntR family transcriptional regulator [Pantoea sp. App145]|uniref:GntR family transcriptional regulator n=1 Tax=Pantoea sp. App145 TaxID=3071567 RepID=UPI003A802BF1